MASTGRPAKAAPAPSRTTDVAGASAALAASAAASSFDRAKDATRGAFTGFGADVRPEDVPGVHPVVRGARLHQHAAALPPLPVPALAATVRGYLDACAPLLEGDDDGAAAALARTRDACDAFLRGPGPQLQAALEAHAAEACGRGKPYPHTHWLEETWDTLAYLSDRNPLSLNVNCMGTLLKRTPTAHPTWRAGALLHGLLRFKRAIDDGSLAPEALDGRGRTPLCMFQYGRLYNHTRLPGKATDRWQAYPDSRHIAILVNNRWYTVDCVRPDGTLLDTVSCVRELDAVLEMAAEDGPSSFDACALTNGRRDVWHASREVLKNQCGAQARATLDKIESAMFHMTFTPDRPGTPEELMNLNCHGHGEHIWMDKSFSMAVAANGKVGFNMEHSHADAPVHSRMVEFAKQVVHNTGFEALSTWDGSAGASDIGAQRLRWGVVADDEDSGFRRDHLRPARAFARAHIAGHRLALLEFRAFGKGLLKSSRISPDSFVQAALQVAFWRDQGGRCTSTYETGTTRAFYHGRTECIRPLSRASRSLCVAMDAASGATLEERHALLRAAIKAHGLYLRKAITGMAIDRHLLGLRVAAAQAGMDMPAMFTDPTFELMNTYELSTSAMPVPRNDDFLGFGAPFPFSYGCCYCIDAEGLLMTITANASCRSKDVERFKGHVSDALRDLGSILARTAEKQQNKLTPPQPAQAGAARASKL